MIVKTFDNGWGPEWPAKQFEKELTDQILHDLMHDQSRTVVINSTWYSQSYHQQVVEQLRCMDFTHLVLVAMLDPAIPQSQWFEEFDCEKICVGYYAGPYNIDYWALFTHKYNHDIAGLSSLDIDTAYMCLNRKPHWHRRRFFQQLKHHGLVDHGLVSFADEQALPMDRPHDDFAPESAADKYGVPNDIASLGHMQNWNRCFLNIVTETAWNINHTMFVSEKIYKPIVGCRPFLVYDTDGGVTWLTHRGFEPYVNDFTDICELDLSRPGYLCEFLRVLCDQPPNYWQKKFVDLHDKIMYNKNQFVKYIDHQHKIIQKGIQCQI